MKYLLLCAFVTVTAVSHASENKVTSDGNAKKAHAIIGKKCVSCHSKDKINLALSSGKDMVKIQLEMEKRGVKLNSNERDVLGIFWKESNPVK